MNREKIVIITGHNILGENLKQTLDGLGYQTTICVAGNDGMQAIIDVMPHLVILDAVLNGADSYDLLAQKQAEPMLAKIPVFLMSTQGVPINMRRVPEGSVSEFVIVLETDPKEILTRINKHFGRATVVAPTATPTDTTLGAAAPDKQKTVLWVEDDNLISSILGKKLISSGFNLIHAKSGDEAFQQLQTVMPDAIVVDLLLPGMNGFEILQHIRAIDKLKKVPVMVLSNLSKPSDIEKARALGGQKFLVKATASLDEIVAEVRSL